jgi:hypothetical protein
MSNEIKDTKYSIIGTIALLVVLWIQQPQLLFETDIPFVPTELDTPMMIFLIFLVIFLVIRKFRRR